MIRLEKLEGLGHVNQLAKFANSAAIQWNLLGLGFCCLMGVEGLWVDSLGGWWLRVQGLEGALWTVHSPVGGLVFGVLLWGDPKSELGYGAKGL